MSTPAETYSCDFHHCGAGAGAGAEDRAFGNLPARSGSIVFVSSCRALAQLHTERQVVAHRALPRVRRRGSAKAPVRPRASYNEADWGRHERGEFAAARLALTADISLLNERAQHLSLVCDLTDSVNVYLPCPPPAPPAAPP
jgi:hypothetical protein